jgi:flagellar motor switch protein FliG
MGVYTRFKRNPEGFRQLVELLELTPSARRQKMIDVGMAEDAAYTQKALDHMMTFEDILKLPDMELAEVLAKTPPRTIAFALRPSNEEVRARFIRCCKPTIGAEVKSYVESEVGLREIGGAQLKMVEIARKLERAGLVKAKKIPPSGAG